MAMNLESSEKRIRKGISFFIVTRTEAIEVDIIKIIHDVGSSDHNITYIKPRKHRESKDIALVVDNFEMLTNILHDIPNKTMGLQNCALWTRSLNLIMGLKIVVTS